MARSPSSELARQWRERLQRFEHAGLTVAEFCQSEGYSVTSFYQWRRKLQSEPSNAQAGAKDRPASFVAVEVQPGMTDSARKFGLEIELPGGAIARLSRDTTDDQQCG